VRADLSSRIARKEYKGGPKLENAYTGVPEIGFGARLTDVGNIIATSQICPRMRGGKSGMKSNFDSQKMAVPRSAI
jgi:hypothetical protein